MTDDLISEIKAPRAEGSIIMVVGVGGAGGNAVNHMWNLGIRGVTFMVCNTDQQALDKSPVEQKIRLGAEGLGAGNDPENGRRAAVETLPEIRQRLEEAGTKMIFITAGMGGGTGTGASPVIAKLAKEMGLLTVAIVTSPLAVEGKIRYEQAYRGIEELRQNVDSLLIINNENILEIYGRLSLKQAFGKADDILASAAKGIAEIITVESDLVNVDFADGDARQRPCPHGRCYGRGRQPCRSRGRGIAAFSAARPQPHLRSEEHPAEHLRVGRRFAHVRGGCAHPGVHPDTCQRAG